MDNQENLAVIAQPAIAAPVIREPAFTIEDILWALGIWSVIISLSPVIAFYMLMVA